MIGVFSMRGMSGLVPVYSVADGVYRNELDGKCIEVMHGYISFKGEPVIFQAGYHLNHS